MMKNAFLFHLKSSFCSQDTQVFVLTFWACRKNSLIRKIRLDFEIYDITAWLTMNYNTHIAQYVMN